MLDSNITILDAYQDRDGNLHCYCDKCYKWHSHGQDAGVRTAHCKPGSGYTRYYLFPVGELISLSKRRRVAKVRNWTIRERRLHQICA